MMLPFYLAAPEVENDRCSLNAFHGTRRAKKDGCWVATAPVSYPNKAYEDGKIHCTKEPYATIMKEKLTNLFSGRYNVS
jgi:hypothetical protein